MELIGFSTVSGLYSSYLEADVNQVSNNTFDQAECGLSAGSLAAVTAINFLHLSALGQCFVSLTNSYQVVCLRCRDHEVEHVFSGFQSAKRMETIFSIPELENITRVNHNHTGSPTKFMFFHRGIF